MASWVLSLVKSVPGASSLRALLDYRFVRLSRNRLDAVVFREMLNDPRFNSIVDDLAAYTGLPMRELESRLLRSPRTHFESEFRWHSPQTVEQLVWFYRCSYGYLFANAAHPYWTKLDMLRPSGGRVLDYGAGVGCNTIELAKRGFDVDHFEICALQSDFVRFRAERRNLKNLEVLAPYASGRFDPIYSIQREYYAIIAMDVFEHIPDYHVAAHHLISRLQPGGFIIETSPFDEKAGPIGIHLRPSVSMREAMIGMREVEPGVWQKLG